MRAYEIPTEPWLSDDERGELSRFAELLLRRDSDITDAEIWALWRYVVTGRL